MTEAEWQSEADLQTMLNVVQERGTARQHRHLMAALVASVVSLLKTSAAHDLVTLLDAYAAGTIPRRQLDDELFQTYFTLPIFDTFGLPWNDANLSRSHGADVKSAVFWVLSVTILELPIFGDLRKWEEIRTRSVEPAVHRWVKQIRSIFQDVVGNPFSSSEFAPSWRTEDVVGLARGMYESRDFAPMPVLADALEDAGCGDPDVLAHCRGPGPHVRGCWVVDLVLGKE